MQLTPPAPRMPTCAYHSELAVGFVEKPVAFAAFDVAVLEHETYWLGRYAGLDDSWGLRSHSLEDPSVADLGSMGLIGVCV